jgi:hypothetical protein
MKPSNQISSVSQRATFSPSDMLRSGLGCIALSYNALNWLSLPNLYWAKGTATSHEHLVTSFEFTLYPLRSSVRLWCHGIITTAVATYRLHCQ